VILFPFLPKLSEDSPVPTAHQTLFLLCPAVLLPTMLPYNVALSKASSARLPHPNKLSRAKHYLFLTKFVLSLCACKP